MAKPADSTTKREIRALDIFSELPPGHILHLHADDMHAPHVRAGEFAVVDTRDRLLRYGEPMLFQLGDRRVVRAARRCGGVVSTMPGGVAEPSASLGGLRRHSTDIGGGHLIEMVDGPYAISDLQRSIVGTVVGVFEAADEGRIERAKPPAERGVRAMPSGWARGEALRFGPDEPFDAARWVAWAEAWGYSFEIVWRDGCTCRIGPELVEFPGRFELDMRLPVDCHHPEDVALWQVLRRPLWENQAVYDHVAARTVAAHFAESPTRR